MFCLPNHSNAFKTQTLSKCLCAINPCRQKLQQAAPELPNLIALTINISGNQTLWDTQWAYLNLKGSWKLLRSYKLIEQHNYTALALVTKMNGNASGVSSWPESSDFVATQSFRRMTCRSTNSWKEMTHKGTLTRHYSPLGFFTLHKIPRHLPHLMKYWDLFGLGVSPRDLA